MSQLTLSRYGYVMGHAATPMPALKFGGTVIYLEQNVASVLDFYRRAFGFDTCSPMKS